MQADEDDGKGLVDMVMDLLGIDPNSIGEDDNLAGMGIDSMQVVEVRARIQRALGRPIPLEEVAPPHTLRSSLNMLRSIGYSSIHLSCCLCLWVHTSGSSAWSSHHGGRGELERLCASSAMLAAGQHLCDRNFWQS